MDADDDGLGDACDAVHCEEPSDLVERPAAAPLLVTRDAAGALRLSWEPTGAAAFHAYRAAQPARAGHPYELEAFGACDLPGGGAGAPVPDEAGSFWYLVLADCGEASSPGRDSLGRLREGPAEPCL